MPNLDLVLLIVSAVVTFVAMGLAARLALGLTEWNSFWVVVGALSLMAVLRVVDVLVMTGVFIPLCLTEAMVLRIIGGALWVWGIAGIGKTVRHYMGRR